MKEVVPLPGMGIGIDAAFVGSSGDLMRTILIFVLKPTDVTVPYADSATSFGINRFDSLKLVVRVGRCDGPHEDRAIIVLNMGFAPEDPGCLLE